MNDDLVARLPQDLRELAVVASCGSTKITVADLGAARTALTGGHHADRG